MNKMNTKSEPKAVNWILNIIIGIATFFFLLTAGVMIEEIVEEVTPTYNENSFCYAVEDEQYASLVGKYYQNTIEGHEGNKVMKEYYGVAMYYEAASLYKAYTTVGNEEQAAVFLEKMEQAQEEMGGWSIAKDSIHKQLGLE